ncbi:hypothetical protein B835_1892 [Enterococcus mundtii 3F]|nr:hypothetical protein [Enterococcus mundtii 3F]
MLSLFLRVFFKLYLFLCTHILSKKETKIIFQKIDYRQSNSAPNEESNDEPRYKTVTSFTLSLSLRGADKGT